MNMYEIGFYVRLRNGGMSVHTMQIQTAQTLDWVKHHADDIVGKMSNRIYCAMHVHQC